MLSNQNSPQSDDGLVKRYEAMVDKKVSSYFDVEEFEEIANYYIESRQHQKAREVVRMAESQHPFINNLQLVDARILLKQKKLTAAIALLRKLERRFSGDAEYWMLTGEVCLELGWTSVSNDAFVHALETADSDYAQFCIDISYLFSGKDKLTLALQYMNKAHKAEPNNLQVIDELSALHTDLQQYDEAEQYIKQHLDQDPYSVDAWFSLGLIYYDQKKELDKAIYAFEYAIVADSTFEMGHYFLGQAYMKNGSYLNALASFKAYEAHTGQKEQAYFLYAECYEEIEEYDKAIEAYEKAIDLGGDKKEAKLGIAYCHIDKKDYFQAMAVFQSILDDHSKCEDAWSGIGDCFQAVDLFQEAKEAYEISIELKPKQVDVYLTLIDMLLKEDLNNEALTLVDKALLIHPQNFELTIKKAVCLYMVNAVYSAAVLIQMLKDKDENTDLFFETLPNALHHPKMQFFLSNTL